MKKNLTISLSLIVVILLSGCSNNQEVEQLKQQNLLLQQQINAQQEISNQNELSQQEEQKIEWYREQCRKWYKWFSEQYVKLLNEYCKNDMSDSCREKYDNTFPNMVPYDIDDFIANCVSRKEQGLSTFDENM